MCRRGRAAVLLLALLAAKSPGGEVELSVWQLPRPEDTNIQTRVQRAVIDGFRRKYPHIRLVSPTGIAIPGRAMMDTGPLMAIAGGVSPDVIYVNFRQSDTYIQEGFLYPLDEWIEKLSPEERAERILPQVEPVVRRWGPGKKTGADPQKHYWALPYGNYIKGLVWRKDIFKEAGLDPERPPKDWDEYYEFARRCTDPAKGTYGILWDRSISWSWHFYSLVVSAGARAMQDRGEDDWYATFNSPEAVTAYEFVVKLGQQRWQHPSGVVVEGVVCRDDATVRWEQGKVAMREMYLMDDFLVSINPELVGFAPVPVGPTGQRASELNCTMCGIFSGTAKKGPDVLDAAWKYVHFLGSPEAKEIRARVLIENGYGRFANPDYLRKLGYEDYVRRIPASWREAFQNAMKDGVPEPYGRNCHMIYEYMARPAEDLLEEGVGLGDRPREDVRARIQQVLDSYVRKANVKMIGHVPPAEMRKRRTVAAVVAAAIAAAFLSLFVYVIRVFTPPGTRRFGGWQFRRYWFAYLILLPALGSVLLWQYVPLLRGTVIAFQDYHILLPKQWVWLDNFAEVLFDTEFWSSLWYSLVYAFLSVAFGFATPIALAVLLHEVPRGKVLFRTLYYLPAVISGLVVMIMWKQFYDKSDSGFLNQIVTGVPWWTSYLVFALLVGAFAAGAVSSARQKRTAAAVVFVSLGFLSALGAVLFARFVGVPRMTSQNWLGDRDWAMLCVVLPSVWAGVGPGCLIYLAALKTIPEDLYESADIDGAGFFAKLWHVTLPSIKVLIIINFIGAVVTAFRVSGYILVMTGGGPGDATKVLALKVFYDAFVYLRFGIATSTAWILGSLLLGFTVFQLKRLSRVEFRAAAAGLR